MTPHQRQEERKRLEAGETQADIARSYNVDATDCSEREARSPRRGPTGGPPPPHWTGPALHPGGQWLHEIKHDGFRVTGSDFYRLALACGEARPS